MGKFEKYFMFGAGVMITLAVWKLIVRPVLPTQISGFFPI